MRLCVLAAGTASQNRFANYFFAFPSSFLFVPCPGGGGFLLFNMGFLATRRGGAIKRTLGGKGKNASSCCRLLSRKKKKEQKNASKKNKEEQNHFMLTHLSSYRRRQCLEFFLGHGRKRRCRTGRRLRIGAAARALRCRALDMMVVLSPWAAFAATAARRPPCLGRQIEELETLVEASAVTMGAVAAILLGRARHVAKGQQGMAIRAAGGALVVVVAGDCRDCSRWSRADAVKCVAAVGCRHFLFGCLCCPGSFRYLDSAAGRKTHDGV